MFAPTMTIWKFPLNIRAESPIKIQMPLGARPLSVQVQGRQPMIWAMVDPANKPCDIEFLLAGTGHEFELPPNAVFIGTFQMYDGSLVLHLFWLSKTVEI